jgi:hypothetical protein
LEKLKSATELICFSGSSMLCLLDCGCSQCYIDFISSNGDLILNPDFGVFFAFGLIDGPEGYGDIFGNIYDLGDF